MSISESAHSSPAEAAQIDAVAEEAVELGRGDDPGDIAVAESKLEGGCPKAGRTSDWRSPRAVIEGAQ